MYFRSLCFSPFFANDRQSGDWVRELFVGSATVEARRTKEGTPNQAARVARSLLGMFERKNMFWMFERRNMFICIENGIESHKEKHLR